MDYLTYVQVNKHGITFYTTYISVDLAHHEIFRAKVGKGGIILITAFFSLVTLLTHLYCSCFHTFAVGLMRRTVTQHTSTSTST